MNAELMNSITGLDVSRFERAKRQAEEQIRQAVPMPDKARYSAGGFSEHPRAMTALAWAALVVVGFAAFWVSAGKQIAATDLALSPVLADYGNRLSPFWADSALVLTLTLGELGTILFTLSGALLGAKRYTLAAFWAAAFLCAGLAVVSNVTITAMHREAIDAMPVYGWLYTIAPPIIVLFVGLYAERLLVQSLESRARAKVAYESALETWREAQERPADSPDYGRALALAVFDQLNRISPANRAKITAAAEADPGVRMALVRREVQRHEWAAFEAFDGNENSHQTAILPVDRPALSNGLHADDDGPSGQGGTSAKRPNDGQTSNKVDAARAWLAQHPETANLSITEVQRLMELAGVKVGRDTAYRAMRGAKE